MNILLSATGGPNVVNAIQSVTGALGSGGGAGGIGLAGALVGVGVVAAGAAVALGVTAVKAAGDFQNSLTSLETGAGELDSNLKMAGDGILQIARDTGSTTKDLTSAMYLIDSAGQHGAQSLQTLHDVSEGAKVGAADMASVANGTTTIMTDYAASNISSAQAVNTLIATISAGKTHMGELSAAMSTILPTSSAVGESLTDTSAAMATMTGEGTDAASAATYLRQLLMALEAPAKKGADALASIGLTTKDVSDEMKMSLPGTLQLITDHLKQKFPEGSAAYVEALKNIAGGSRQMQGILELTGTHLDVFKSNVDGITNAVNKGGNSILGWDKVQGNFNFQMSKFREIGETLFITLGQKLLPIVTTIVSQALIPAATWVSNLLSGTQPLSSSFSQISNTLSTEFGPSLQRIISLISGQYLDMFKFAADETKQLAGWYQSTLVPALKEAEPGFMNLAHVVLDQLIPAFISVRGVVIDVVEHAIKTIGPIIGEILPYWVKFEGLLANLNASALKEMIPLVVNAAKAWGEFAKGIMDREAPIIQHAIEIIVNLVKFLYNIWMAVWPVLAPIVKLVFTEMQGTIQFWWSFFSGIINLVLDILGGQWGKALDDAGAMFKGMFAGLKTFLGGWWQFIVTLFSPIGKWFADRFTGAKNGITSAFGAIGHWFGDRWTDIKNVFAAIGSWFHDRFTEAYNFITGVFKNIGQWFIDRWNDIVKGFEWLYNHNYYFKNLVDFIHNVFNNVINWLKTAWTTVSNWLVGAWNNLVTFAKDLWAKVSNAVRDGWNASIAFVHDIWVKISDFFFNAWATWIVGPLTSLWSNVSNFFANAWANWVVGPLTSLWSNISSFFSNAWNNYVIGPVEGLGRNLGSTIRGWANSAYNWGKNLIQGFINGIKDMGNNVKNAAGDIMNNVANILGFHSPAKEGPGRDLMTWGPGLIKGFSEGMESAIPVLKSSLNLVMQPIASTLSGGSPTIAPTGGYASRPQVGTTIIYAPVFNISTLASSPSEVRRLTDMINEEQSKTFRLNTSNYGAGGIY